MAVIAATKPEKFLQGTNGSFTITVGSVETDFQITKADLTVEVSEDDVTHSGAGGWYVPLGGVYKLSGTITFTYDLANKPSASPYAVKCGKYAACKVYGNSQAAANLATGDASSSEVWAGSVFFKNAKFGTGPKNGPVEVSVDVTNNGPWTGPFI